MLFSMKLVLCLKLYLKQFILGHSYLNCGGNYGKEPVPLSVILEPKAKGKFSNASSIFIYNFYIFLIIDFQINFLKYFIKI